MRQTYSPTAMDRPVKDPWLLAPNLPVLTQSGASAAMPKGKRKAVCGHLLGTLVTTLLWQGQGQGPGGHTAISQVVDPTSQRSTNHADVPDYPLYTVFSLILLMRLREVRPLFLSHKAGNKEARPQTKHPLCSWPWKIYLFPAISLSPQKSPLPEGHSVSQSCPQCPGAL